jgi:lactoylglutathione lyase
VPRAFPIIYTPRGQALGGLLRRPARLPRDLPHSAGDDAGYIGLELEDSRLGIVDEAWPAERIGVRRGDAPRFELWVYVDDVDATVERMRAADVPVLMDAEDMPWGERMAYVADPDSNPVALASPPPA